MKSNPSYASFKSSRYTPLVFFSPEPAALMTRGIDVTVAAVIERDGKFSVVEERVGGKLVLNQPAGHLEQGESLLAAVAREALEETGHRFEPEHVVGFYLWRRPTTARPSCASPSAARASHRRVAVRLDEGIVATHWLTRTQLRLRQNDLRSPMVLRCLDDYLAGARRSLDTITHLADAPPETVLARRARR